MQSMIHRILEIIGEDPSREGLLETPSRVEKSYKFLFSGYETKPEDIFKDFKNENGSHDGEPVLLKNVEFFSMCEHHMLPFFGKAHIAYFPNERIAGVSKLARLLDIYAKRLQIQERLGHQVTKTLMKLLKARGAACVLEAQHLCMTMRGVQKQNSIMVTTSLQGCYRDDPNMKMELLLQLNK